MLSERPLDFANPPEPFGSRRLWSLWDLMHQFDGGKFVVYLVGLATTAASVKPDTYSVFPVSVYDELKESIGFLKEELRRLDLRTSLVSAQQVSGIINDQIEVRAIADIPLQAREQFAARGDRFAVMNAQVSSSLRHSAYELIGRVKDELSASMLMSVSPSLMRYAADDLLFGIEVFNAFPSANDDISEAGKCLAYERGTAAVMHLMRAAEVGLSALGSALGITKQNDWGSYLREIEKELGRRAKTSGARTVDEQFYSESAASFDHLKRAWRNPTMHVDRSYSPERAEEILQTLRSFMRHLATKISE